jgi:hypothetical protein
MRGYSFLAFHLTPILIMSHWLLLEGEIVESDVYRDIGCTNRYGDSISHGLIGYIRRPTKTEEVVYHKRYGVWHGLKDSVGNYEELIKSHWRKERRRRSLATSKSL